MVKKIWLFSQNLFAASVLGLGISWIVPAIAQTNRLSEAEIYKLVNQVKLIPQNKESRSAKLSDTLVPLDALRTETRSRAELLFNEGTLARIGGNTHFQFIPGMRNFQLTNGTAILMSRSGNGNITVTTPEARIEAQGRILWVRRDSTTQTTDVGALTNNPSTPVIVYNSSGSDRITLKAGQRISVVEGELQPVEELNLPTFYGICKLSDGLGPTEAENVNKEPPEVRETLNLVRAETNSALQAQLREIDEQGIDPDTAALCDEVPQE